MIFHCFENNICRARSPAKDETNFIKDFKGAKPRAAQASKQDRKSHNLKPGGALNALVRDNRRQRVSIAPEIDEMQKELESLYKNWDAMKIAPAQIPAVSKRIHLPLMGLLESVCPLFSQS